MVHARRWRLSTLVLAVGVALGVSACQRGEDEAIGTFRIYDLLQAFPRATVTAPAPNFVAVRSGPVGKEDRRGLFMHPPSSAAFPAVTVGEDSVLRFAIGVQDDAWDKSGDGVEFVVLVRGPDNKETRIFSRYIDPKHQEHERRWIGVRLPLRAFAGQAIRIVLRTTPGPANNPDADWAFWGEPEIVLERR